MKFSRKIFALVFGSGHDPADPEKPDEEHALEQRLNAVQAASEEQQERLQAALEETRAANQQVAFVEGEWRRALAAAESLRREKEQEDLKRTKQILELPELIQDHFGSCSEEIAAQSELKRQMASLEGEMGLLLQRIGSNSPTTNVLKTAGESDGSVEDGNKESRGQNGVDKGLVVEKMNMEIVHLSEKITQIAHQITVDTKEFQAKTANMSNDRLKKDEVETAELSTVLGTAPTPRSTLVHQLYASRTPVTQSPSIAAVLKSCTIATLKNDDLDIAITPAQARRLAASVKGGDLMVLSCHVCQQPKFTPTSPGPRVSRINEFWGPSRPTTCCSNNICTQCYLKEIVHSLTRDWWADLGKNNWLKCPGRTCTQLVPIRGRAGLAEILRQLNDPYMDRHLNAYKRILHFRRALNKLKVPLTDAVLTGSAVLHNHLVSGGYMHDITDLKVGLGMGIKTSIYQPQMVNVDYRGRSIQVPLFPQFLRRETAAKECSVCAEKIYDVDIKSLERWTANCAGIKGDWMWQVLPFPVMLKNECGHDIDFCTGCLQRHIETQIEQHGRSRCDQLPCLSGECDRLLTYNEIKLYAKTRTFARYDQFLRLKALSECPGFRWCLGPGCTNGQIYDMNSTSDPRVACGECAFEICFHHSEPWHTGMTCEQYDSKKEHGDPDFKSTKDWIMANTKACPGCNQRIQKGEACFHMTCSVCSFEFCWECLVDYQRVRPQDSSVHFSASHREGCPFRTNGYRPASLCGTSVAEALRRRQTPTG